MCILCGTHVDGCYPFCAHVEEMVAGIVDDGWGDVTNTTRWKYMRQECSEDGYGDVRITTS